MRSGFNPPVGSSEVPLQFPRDPCVCGRDRARERPREGEQSPVSGYRPARPPPRAAECTAGPGSAAAPLRAGPRPARGPREPRARRAAEELGSGAKVSSQLWPRALPLPPPTPARGLGPTPPPPGPGPGPGRQFRFGGRGAAARAGPEPEPEPEPEQEREEQPGPRLLRPPATWEVALPAAACSQIDSRPPAAACPGRRGVAASP